VERFRELAGLEARLLAGEVALERHRLEVGVGEGEVAGRVRDRYPSARFVGIDLPDPALAAHWAEQGMNGAFADIVRLPFPDATFDLVLAIEVLEHVPDPEASLRELSRLATNRLVVGDKGRWAPLGGQGVEATGRGGQAMFHCCCIVVQ